jgi:hypothetical protein
VFAAGRRFVDGELMIANHDVEIPVETTFSRKALALVLPFPLFFLFTTLLLLVNRVQKLSRDWIIPRISGGAPLEAL